MLPAITRRPAPPFRSRRACIAGPDNGGAAVPGIGSGQCRGHPLLPDRHRNDGRDIFPGRRDARQRDQQSAGLASLRPWRKLRRPRIDRRGAGDPGLGREPEGDADRDARIVAVAGRYRVLGASGDRPLQGTAGFRAADVDRQPLHRDGACGGPGRKRYPEHRRPARQGGLGRRGRLRHAGRGARDPGSLWHQREGHARRAT